MRELAQKDWDICTELAIETGTHMAHPGEEAAPRESAVRAGWGGAGRRASTHTRLHSAHLHLNGWESKQGVLMAPTPAGEEGRKTRPHRKRLRINFDNKLHSCTLSASQPHPATQTVWQCLHRSFEIHFSAAVILGDQRLI